MAGQLKCGCVVGAYWCSKHDIYTGNTPPWGAGERRHAESYKVFKEEWQDDDRHPECCSCHLSAPCGWCERTQNDEDESA